MNADFRELLHTSSARPEVLCAAVFLWGLISYRVVLIPNFVIWFAASTPASPAPIMVIDGCFPFIRKIPKWSVSGLDAGYLV